MSRLLSAAAGCTCMGTADLLTASWHQLPLFLPRDALSAKRGLAIACRPSVRLSVRL